MVGTATIAVTDGQSAARAEIILHVDHEKQVVMGADLHSWLLLETMTAPNRASFFDHQKSKSKWPLACQGHFRSSPATPSAVQA